MKLCSRYPKLIGSLVVFAGVTIGAIGTHTSWASSSERIDLSPLGEVVDPPSLDPSIFIRFDENGLMEKVYGPDGEVLLSYSLDPEAGTLAITNSVGETRNLTLLDNGLLVSAGGKTAEYRVASDDGGFLLETCITNEIATECFDADLQLTYRKHLETGEEFFFEYDDSGDLSRVTTGSGEEVFKQTTRVVDGNVYRVLRLENIEEWYLAEQLVYRLNYETLEERHLFYDEDGRLKRVLDGDLAEIWVAEYLLGASGEVLEVTVTLPDAVEVYNDRGQILRRLDKASGEEWIFFYNSLDKLDRVEDGSGSILLENHYDALGELIRTDIKEGEQQIDYGPSGSPSTTHRTIQRIQDEDGNVVEYTHGPGITTIRDLTRDMEWVLDNNQAGSPLVSFKNADGISRVSYGGGTATIENPDKTQDVYEYIGGEMGRHLGSLDANGKVLFHKRYNQRKGKTVYVVQPGEWVWGRVRACFRGWLGAWVSDGGRDGIGGDSDGVFLFGEYHHPSGCRDRPRPGPGMAAG